MHTATYNSCTDRGTTASLSTAIIARAQYTIIESARLRYIASIQINERYRNRRYLVVLKCSLIQASVLTQACNMCPVIVTEHLIGQYSISNLCISFMQVRACKVVVAAEVCECRLHVEHWFSVIVHCALSVSTHVAYI
jgi:hypothetical protein